MDTNKICFSCFNEHDGNGPCPNCGFDISKVKHPYIALPIGTILNGRYLTGRVLGVGGFGVTYVAFDMTLEICVAVKEFLPSGLAFREDDHYTMTVKAPEDQEKFDTGVSKFLEEARLLAKLHDVPNIVTIHDYFRENNTAYFVMEYIEGVDLMKYTQMHGGKLSFNETIRLVLPIIDSLAHVHAHNLLHRDISPDNIVVMKNGSTRLLDFGAARLAVDSTKSKSIILKHGFAPEEQYRKRGNQGPWSDEYALAATMYLIMTGEMPPDAFDRVHEDTLKSPIELGVDIPQYANDALMKAMAVKASERFPDMSSFSAAITGQPLQGVTPVPVPVSVMQGSEQNDLMVQGKTVNIEPEEMTVSEQSQEESVVTNQIQTEEGSDSSEKVLSPSLMNPQENIVDPQPENTSVVIPQIKKKSIWKRPLTYVLAGIAVLVAIAIPTGIYISKNYTWGDVETSKTKRSKKTSASTQETEVTYLDPEIFEEDGGDRYYDSVRQISIQVPKDYDFENDEGHYKFENQDGTLTIYMDSVRSVGQLRVNSLVDFVAQDREIIQEYLRERTGDEFAEFSFGKFEILPDEQYALCYYIDSVNGGVDMHFILYAYESTQDQGVYIVCGQTDETIGGNDSYEISVICESFREEAKSSSDYDYFAADDPYNFYFLYRISDIESINSVDFMDGCFSLDIKLKGVGSENSRINVIHLGYCDSIMDACQFAEQNLGTKYKIGGYQSVTPLARADLDTRVRNYTLSLRDDSNVTLDATVCVLNMYGEYYAVVATCDSVDDLERLALDFTMIIKSFGEFPE